MVQFYPDAHPTLFTLVDMQEELQAIFGRDVDLMTRAGIENSRNPFRRREILSSAVVIYEAGHLKQLTTTDCRTRESCAFRGRSLISS